MKDIFIEWLGRECPGEDVTLTNQTYTVRFGWFFWDNKKQVHEQYDLTDMMMVLGFKPNEVRQLVKALPFVAYDPNY